jgi:hypothetical protein
MRRAVVLVATMVLCSWSALAADPPKPPPAVVPELTQSNPPILCVDCDAPFDMETHKQLLKDLANNPYVAELRKGLYFQDVLHQFESKAHFDNCDFDSAMDYMVELLAETQSHVDAAQSAKSSNDAGAMQAAAKRAFLALGQAVHGVQDFYAHSNYVELQAPKVRDVVDIEIITPWRPIGRERVKQLQSDGLISGFVFWGFPQKCPANTLSHGDLAKDSDSTKSGKRLVPHLQNISQYRIAVFLAREASLKFMNDAFRRWPLLKEINGPPVAVDVLIDRREF